LSTTTNNGARSVLFPINNIDRVDREYKTVVDDVFPSYIWILATGRRLYIRTVSSRPCQVFGEDLYARPVFSAVRYYVRARSSRYRRVIENNVRVFVIVSLACIRVCKHTEQTARRTFIIRFVCVNDHRVNGARACCSST